MPPENYRYYCLDRLGRLHDVEWFYAESDEDAVARVEATNPDALCEIWQDKRLVAKLSPSVSPHVNMSAAAGRSRSQLQSA